MKLHHLLCLTLLGCVVHHINGLVSIPTSATNVLTIGAFNVQNLSPKKINDANVFSIIIQILDRYDVVLVQELVDRNERIVDLLLEKLNR